MSSSPVPAAAPEAIPLSVPVVAGNEWTYVKECLDTGWVSSAGKYVERFERDIAHYTGAKHAVACVNGTAALHVALELAGVLPGDEVLAPTVTFIATVNAVRYARAEPVFLDCDEFYNLDVEKLRQFLDEETVSRDGQTYNKRTQRRIAAVLPVHVFGNAVRLEELLATCQERNLCVVEDAAESLGTFYTAGRLAGKHSGTLGRLGCLSFNGNKIITTGGGGMILTDDATLAGRAKYLTTTAKRDEVRFVHDDVGYNYRLTNLQAAMGVAQLEQLPSRLEIKRRNFQAYQRALDGVPGLHLAETPPYADSNHWMYALQINATVYGADRETVMARLAQERIQTRPLWFLNHRQRPYQQCQHHRIEQAERLWEITLNLPCSTDLTAGQIQRTVNALTRQS
jgi:aminotransferase in exopolysaccharide biosynthesis